MSVIPPAPNALDDPLDGRVKESTVGVFWDHESCPHPQGYSGIAVVRCIRTTALGSGSILRFNVYIDITPDDQVTPKRELEDEEFRKELRTCGVSVLDSPGKRTKTVADKTIIVDLFAFALRHRPSATLLVISADPDLAYSLSLLRQRQFKVILISSSTLPKEIEAVLSSQSDAFLTWQDLLKDEKRTPATFHAAAPTQVANPGTSQQQPVSATPAPKPRTLVQTPTVLTRPVLGLGHTAGASAVPPSGPLPGLNLPVAQLSSLNPHRYQTRSVTASTSTLQPESQTAVPFVPKHLHPFLDVLAQAKKLRGWHESLVCRRIAKKTKVEWTEEQAVQRLEEAVSLGLVTRTVRMSGKKKNRPKTSYAMEETLKAKWKQISSK